MTTVEVEVPAQLSDERPMQYSGMAPRHPIITTSIHDGYGYGFYLQDKCICKVEVFLHYEQISHWGFSDSTFSLRYQACNCLKALSMLLCAII